MSRVLSLRNKTIKRSVRSWSLVIPLFFLVGGLLSTYFSWKLSNDFVNQLAEQEFRSQNDHIVQNITNRLDVYKNFLEGMQGLFAASNEVSYDEWDTYIINANIETNYPGLSSIVYTKRVGRDQLEEFEKTVQKEGLTNFKVFPTAEKDDYFVARYIYPYDDTTKNALGYDISSEIVRKEAITQSRDNNEFIITGPVQLASDFGKEPEPSFILFAPLYANGATLDTARQRNEALNGFVSIGFHAREFFSRVQNESPKNIGFMIYDAEIGQDKKIYASLEDSEFQTLHSRYTEDHQISLYGRTWVVHFITLPNFQNTLLQQLIPFVVGLGGALIAFFLGGLLWALTSSQRRAVKIADEMTAKIKEDEEQFENLFEYSADPMHITDLQGKFLAVNETAINRLGYTVDEFLAGNVAMLCRVPQDKVLRDANRQLQELGRVLYQTEYQTKNKKILPVEINSRIIQYDGQSSVLSVIRDLSSRRESEQKLKTFELAVESASDHMVITDPDGFIIYANKAVGRITGFSPEEVIGKKAGAKNLWGGLMEPEFYQTLWHTIKNEKKVFAGQVKNRRKNGEEYWALASIAPVLNDVGEIIFFVGIERDITKEKQIDQAKTEFVSLASHQLRTPLSTIGWYSEMLLSEDVGKLNDEQRSYLQEVYKGNKRMVDLVNALLNVSRIDLGTFAVEPEPTDLREIAEINVKELIPLATKKNITIIKEFAPDTPILNVDPKLMSIIFQNLLSNAVKYTPDNGKVTLIIKRIDREVRIEIKDTGYGIPVSQKDKIFTKLFRADNVRQKEAEGTGLGLYIVKAIVDQSEGKIWFESQENKGTTFYISLPILGMKPKKGNKELTA